MRQGVSILLNHVTSRRRTQVAAATAALNWLAIGYRFFLVAPLAGRKLKSGGDALFMPVHEALMESLDLWEFFALGASERALPPGDPTRLLGLVSNLLEIRHPGTCSNLRRAISRTVQSTRTPFTSKFSNLAEYFDDSHRAAHTDVCADCLLLD
jgi:hypothetical protein